MGIFRDITKSLKQAAPIIGAGIGMYYGGPMGASIGSGIGSLASGRSAEESLRNAALAGATTYAMGGADFGKGFNFSTAGSPFASAPTSIANAPTVSSVSTNTGVSDFATNPNITAFKQAAEPSMFDKALGFVKENPYLTTAGVGTLLGAASGIGELDDEDERKQYFEDNKKRRETETVYSAAGGEVNGPGTGTSDSVPARLSDGEFVLTAKAMRGAGGGDRDVGAARMYDMMSQLERVA